MIGEISTRITKSACSTSESFTAWSRCTKKSCAPSRRANFKELVIAYQQECDEVLWKHWNDKIQRHRQGSAHAPNHGLADSTFPDTAPREPLVFPYRDGQGHEIQIRVAIHNGQAACVVFDLANALGEKEREFLK